ncbi:hypothetical protein BT69DRAFT_1287032 [Atractiella rhizophila]|nr:hypothetical protein BT69DRAFT_1287032 [Atractiella rhizophila]
MSLTALEELISHHKDELTTLYTRLSSNPNQVVESKLKQLHQQLIATVEKQRDDAREELKRTEAQVEELTEELHGIGECLGQKEECSCSEGETLTAFRERLHQRVSSLKTALQTRVSQFRSVQQKLHSFIPLLGSSFFTPGLEVGDPSSTSDNTSWRGRSYTPSMLERLKQEITRCTQEVERRAAILHSDLSEILTLWSELEINPCTTEPQRSDSEAPPYPCALEEVEFDAGIMAHLGLPDGRETKARERREWLEREKERRESLIQALFDKLTPLWTRLGTTEEECDQFMEENKGVGGESIQAYQRELERMLQKKAENMEVFIKREREEISSLWDQLFYGQNQRSSWSPFYSKSFTEEELEKHELEKGRLLEELSDKEAILKLLTKYFSVLADAEELEASAQDSSRLTGKTTRGDPGRLLREEKARKRVQKEKPKLELELTNAIPQWEENKQQPFLVNGSRFLDDLHDRLEQEAAKRGGKKQSKGPSLSASTSRCNTPAPLRAQRTGGNATAPLKTQKTGDRSAVQPLKRQMTGGTQPPSTATKRTRTLSATTPGTSVPRASKPQGLNESTNASRSSALASSVGMGFPSSSQVVRLPAGWGNQQTHQSQLEGVLSPTPPYLQQQANLSQSQRSAVPYRPSTAMSMGSSSSTSIFSNPSSRTVSTSGTSVFSDKIG